MNAADSSNDIDPNKPSETSTDATPPVAQPADGRRLPLVLATLALIVSLGLAVTAYFIWYQVRQVDAEQSGIETGVGERIQPLRAALERLEQGRRQDADALQARIAGLQEDQQAMAHRLSVLAAQIGRSETGWALAEVEYLLRIANQRLQLQRDTDTAVQALQAADARLRDLADPLYQNVRQQIARDLDAIGAVAKVDVDGLAATLSAALSEVDALPIEGSRYTPPTQSAIASGQAPAEANSIAELGRLVWHSLSELFRVREHERPVGPLLPPDQAYFLRGNLRLQLEAARVALLRGDQVQYRSSLQTAIDWLQRYFEPQASDVQQQLSRLQDIAAVDIAPAMPDVSGSLRLLRQQMQLGQQQKILPVVPGSGDEADGKREAGEDKS